MKRVVQEWVLFYLTFRRYRNICWSHKKISNIWEKQYWWLYIYMLYFFLISWITTFLEVVKRERERESNDHFVINPLYSDSLQNTFVFPFTCLRPAVLWKWLSDSFSYAASSSDHLQFFQTDCIHHTETTSSYTNLDCLLDCKFHLSRRANLHCV